MFNSKKIKELERRIAKLENKPAGMVYVRLSPWDMFLDWIMFYEKDISDRVDNKIKILGKWYDKSDIIEFNNYLPYLKDKKRIEKQYWSK